MWSRQYPVALLSVKPLQARPDRGDTRLKEVVKLSQQKKGRERNTRVGIVGFLTVQPEQLPVICFVVNAESLGDMSDRAGGISCRLSSDRCCVHGLVSDWVWLHMECEFSVWVCVSVCVGYVVSAFISRFSVAFVSRRTKTFLFSISANLTFQVASVTRLMVVVLQLSKAAAKQGTVGEVWNHWIFTRRRWDIF